MDKQGIIETSKKRREGERIFYTSCPANGCWDSACVLKCHEKDGKIIAIEPDDSVNPNDSREDCGWENTWKGNVQMRPCAMGHSWKKELHADTRLLHPMKRVGKKGPGQGYFVQISWEEALDTIAEKMKEIKGKYGPLRHLPFPVSQLREERLPAGSLVGGGLRRLGRAFHLGTRRRRDAAPRS